ncbi:hypothetical protein BD779DRAFT_1500163 [Infundibulicybe gibba]|nr:hypothetical protein BD779DRAFT_1500163 [Infundibulicybe gibba]
MHGISIKPMYYSSATSWINMTILFPAHYRILTGRLVPPIVYHSRKKQMHTNQCEKLATAKIQERETHGMHSRLLYPCQRFFQPPWHQNSHRISVIRIEHGQNHGQVYCRGRLAAVSMHLAMLLNCDSIQPFRATIAKLGLLNHPITDRSPFLPIETNASVPLNPVHSNWDDPRAGLPWSTRRNRTGGESTKSILELPPVRRPVGIMGVPHQAL